MTQVTVKAAKTKSWLWLQGLLCGGALSLFPAASIVIVALLAPAALATISDRTAKKPVGKAMMMLAGATAVTPLHTLLAGNYSIDNALAIVANPAVLATAWLATAAGWIVSEGTSIASYEFTGMITRRQIAILTAERTKLEQEWPM